VYKIKKIYLKPLYNFLFIWVIFISLRFLPIIKWHDLDLNTTLYLILIFFTIIVTYIFMGLYVTNKKPVVTIVNVNKIKIKKLYFYFLFFSLISLILIILKFYLDMSIYSTNPSLSGLTDLRYAKMEDTQRVGTILSTIATMSSGFIVIFFIFSYWYQDRLPNKYYQLSLVFFVFYIFSTLLSGGRNGFLISILLIIFSIYYKNLFKKDTKRKRINIKKVGIIFTSIFIFLYVSGIIFLDRMELRGRTLISSFEYIANAYNIEFNQYLISLLNIEGLNILVFLFLFLFFYLMHSLDQFNLVFISPVGELFPYLGAMTFYPIVQLLNKFGLEIITIADIKNDIVNPGNYTTLFGGLYLDFSIMGSLIFLMLIVILFVHNYYIFLRKKSFLSYMILILISITFLVSPIYSFLGLGVFMPIIFALLVFYIISKFIKVDSYQIFEKRN